MLRMEPNEADWGPLSRLETQVSSTDDEPLE